MKVGVVKMIWRYPVKGMAGESLPRAELNHTGILGDRTWAVQDIKRQEIQSCKFRPELLLCKSRLRNDGTTVINFPTGETLFSDDLRAGKLISALVGHESRLQPLQPATNSEFYKRFKEDDHTWLQELKATFAREPGEPLPDLDNLPPQMQQYVSILGTFFLVSPFHILTTASLNHMAASSPEADWNIERFRPNVVIESLPEFTGLVEQAWLAKRLMIGNAEVHCTDTAPRCGAVTRAQQNLEKNTNTLRHIVKNADQNLGIYGNIIQQGDIQVGDNVHLVTD